MLKVDKQWKPRERIFELSSVGIIVGVLKIVRAGESVKNTFGNGITLSHVEFDVVVSNYSQQYLTVCSCTCSHFWDFMQWSPPREHCVTSQKKAAEETTSHGAFISIHTSYDNLEMSHCNQYTLISFPDLLRTKLKARSGQIQFALRDHLSGM